MSTVRETLRGITNFPIPERTLEAMALKRGLSLDETASYSTLNSKTYLLVEADLLKWLSQVANMSQGGQSYSFTAEERNAFKQQADKLYGQAESENSAGVRYGYKGDRL